MNRKNFLKSMALGAASTSILVAACGGDAPKTETTTAPAETPAAVPAEAAPAATADCTDLSGLSEAERKQRESVGYVNASTEADKNCTNCRFMQVGTQPNGCNGCQLFKGPIVPEGYCKSWFKKDA
jgi:hypothetical protein